VPGQLKVLVHFENRPAGDYHAVCAAFRHQGSGCAWPCLWCQVRNFGGNARLCKQCGRYSCHHSAFTGIHPSILPLKSIDALELGAQPACYATTVEASREGLQPRRQQQQTVAEKAAGAEAKALGAIQGCTTGGGGTKRRGRATQSVVAAKQPAKPNPLDPSVPIFVHPEVKDELDLHTLRLPPPAPPRTMESFHVSGELAARFGCYQPTTATGKTYVWAEVNPALMEHGALKSTWDREFLQMRCTDILIEDGIISSDGSGFKDSHGNSWRFPTHRGDSSVNGK
jgi:hypothetical protein